MSIRILLLAAGLLAAAPADAQTVAGTQCAAVPQEAPRDFRRSAADSARDAAKNHAVATIKNDVLESAFRAGIQAPEGLVVLEVRGRRAQHTTIHPWRTNVSAELVQGAVDRHLGLLAMLPERDRVLSMRLDPLALPDSLTVECLPRLVDTRQFTEEVARIAERAMPLSPGSDPRVQVHVRMLVSRDGEVAYATVSRRGNLGSLDRQVLDAARRLRFVPASVGGMAVDVWVEQPVVLEVPVRPSDDRRP
jgi:TonB family protein